MAQKVSQSKPKQSIIMLYWWIMTVLLCGKTTRKVNTSKLRGSDRSLIIYHQFCSSHCKLMRKLWARKNLRKEGSNGYQLRSRKCRFTKNLLKAARTKVRSSKSETWCTRSLPRATMPTVRMCRAMSKKFRKMKGFNRITNKTIFRSSLACLEIKLFWKIQSSKKMPHFLEYS